MRGWKMPTVERHHCSLRLAGAVLAMRGADVGATKRGKGMKIMAIVDRHGLPLSVSTHAANHHEVRLVQLCFDFYMIEAKPENLIGDRAYDSDPLDKERRRDGIEMIAPHRANRSKMPTQDRRRLSRYMRRWLWRHARQTVGGPACRGLRRLQLLKFAVLTQQLVGLRLDPARACYDLLGFDVSFDAH